MDGKLVVLMIFLHCLIGRLIKGCCLVNKKEVRMVGQGVIGLVGIALIECANELPLGRTGLGSYGAFD